MGIENIVFEFEGDIDEIGKITVPSHLRRDAGIYKRAARLRVKFSLIKVYGEGGGR